MYCYDETRVQFINYSSSNPDLFNDPNDHWWTWRGKEIQMDERGEKEEVKEEAIGMALERAARSLTRLWDGLRNKLEIWHNTRVSARIRAANFYHSPG